MAILELYILTWLQQSFGIKTAGLEEKSTACQMLVCYARELKEGFAEYTEQVVKIMVSHLKFYFHDGRCKKGIIGINIVASFIVERNICYPYQSVLS